MNDVTIFTIQMLLYVTAFGLGFVIGKITGPRIADPIDAKGSFFNPVQRQKRVVEIDDKKFVTDITTDKLIKKGGELGTQVIVNDDVGTSVSRLAQLKKNK